MNNLFFIGLKEGLNKQAIKGLAVALSSKAQRDKPVTRVDETLFNKAVKAVHERQMVELKTPGTATGGVIPESRKVLSKSKIRKTTGSTSGFFNQIGKMIKKYPGRSSAAALGIGALLGGVFSHSNK